MDEADKIDFITDFARSFGEPIEVQRKAVTDSWRRKNVRKFDSEIYRIDLEIKQLRDELRRKQKALIDLNAEIRAM